MLYNLNINIKNKIMKINWKKPTRFSMIIAIIIYIATFALAFYIGEQYGEAKAVFSQAPKTQDDSNNIINATFICDGGKEIDALFFDNKVQLSLSDGRNYLLLQNISASGARYTNETETFVFWNKGDTAFVEENDTTTYDNCLTKI